MANMAKHSKVRKNLSQNYKSTILNPSPHIPMNNFSSLFLRDHFRVSDVGSEHVKSKKFLRLENLLLLKIGACLILLIAN